MSFTAFQSMSHKQEQLKADIVGQQIKNVGEAVNIYIANHYDALSTLSNSTGITTDVGPRTCTAASSSCVITTTTLTNEGLLPPTFSGKNAFNSAYTIVLKRSGTSPYYTISGLVTTTDPWKGPGNVIRYDWLGTAMQSAGLDSGMTRDIATRVNGYNGQWVVDNTSYSNITQLGQLAYITGYGSNSYSVYLRRDGVLPMTGQLNMNGNDIGNARNITASNTITGGILHSKGNVIAHNEYGHQLTIGGDALGNDFDIRIGPGGKGYLGVLSTDQSPVTLAANGTLLARSPTTSLTSVSLDGTTGNILATGDITGGGWVKAKNGYGDIIGLGGDAAGNDYEIKMESDSKSLAIFAPFLPAAEKILRVSNTVWDKNTGNIITNGVETFSLFKSGDLTTAGNITSKKEIMATNGYGDTLAIGGDAAANDYEIRLGTDKPLTIYSPNKASASSIVFQVGGASSLGGDTKVSGNITASGNINGAYFQPTSTVAVGGTCASTGLMSKDSEGFLLSCQSGKWERQFNPAVTIRNDGVWAKNSDFQACNSDEVVVGGGGQCEEPSSHYIHYSAPSNNGWSIDCFPSNPSTGVDKGSLTYAICMKK